MYLPDHGCLYIHIPKTGGNSIMRVFGISWESHKDLARYSAELGDDVIDSLFVFTTVRNPWERILSEYNFQRKKSQRKDTVRLFLCRPDGSERSFAEWVDYALAHPHEHGPRDWGGKTSPHIHRLSPQVDWLSSEPPREIDFVARTESLNADFKEVCRRLGIPERRLPRRNRKLHWHYKRYYDSATQKRVASYYERDIDTFGYIFGDG